MANKKKQKLEPGVHLHTIKKSGRLLYFWYMVSKNGRVVMRSGEEYKSKQWAVKNLLNVANHFENNQHYFDHSSKVAENLVIYSI